eukprot:TRINITY_DN10604_c0_g1_i1.p2 TRINITY_DN10604_c0_g1~~TRINITY_DN10604_c0_g1_i1.p2  ORF type:complete len:102 (-),score=10.54 TRINITY_DN10604_c0_g1_i1:678-983(-)
MLGYGHNTALGDVCLWIVAEIGDHGLYNGWQWFQILKFFPLIFSAEGCNGAQTPAKFNKVWRTHSSGDQTKHTPNTFVTVISLSVRLSRCILKLLSLLSVN